MLAAMVLVALLAPFVSPHDPSKTVASNPLAPPQPGLLLGGDEIGRDVLSRIIWGARISLYVGLVSVAIGATAGAVWGITSAHFGGKTDLISQRMVDSLMAFPALILALAIMAVLGRSVNNVVIAIALTQIPRAARTVRSQALSVKETSYIEAARAIGCSHARIIFQHIMPNCVAPWIVFATAELGHAIVVEASLSFLGLGTPPHVPSWGAMLSRAAGHYVGVAPWLAIYPGLALSSVVFAFNLLGDAVRDVLDPRLRQR